MKKPRDQKRKVQPGRPPPIRANAKDPARWVVGIHSCHETLKVRPKAVRELWLRPDWMSSQALRPMGELAGVLHIKLREKSVGQLDAVGAGNQGVALACLQSPEVDWQKLKDDEHGLILILDGIEDPHNLGSMLRTSWLTGVEAIFIPSDRAVGLTPAVCKVASGGAEHVAVSVEANIGALIANLKEAGYWVYGLAESGKGKPWDFRLAKKTAWVIGSESAGIRTATERACDEVVRLPQIASGSSFNAAIACAMALAESVRQSGRPE